MAEGGEQDGRQELLDRLAGARSRLEVADARAAADRWLAEHPDDKEVRRAVDRSGPAQRDEEDVDLEEGSPT